MVSLTRISQGIASDYFADVFNMGDGGDMQETNQLGRWPSCIIVFVLLALGGVRIHQK